MPRLHRRHAVPCRSRRSGQPSLRSRLGRYRLQATISGATHSKLRRAQELLRREIPDGDPGTILDRALALLLEDIARRKLAAAAKPRPAEKSVPVAGTRAIQSRTRHIPASVRRAVWLRDDGRCAFVAANGRRCSERVYVEFHHCAPYAIGGESSVENISLRCRAHNAYEAELDFGPGRARNHGGSRSDGDGVEPGIHGSP